MGLLNIFKKKKEEVNEEPVKEEDEESDKKIVAKKSSKKEESLNPNLEIQTLSSDVDRIKASVESFSEVRQSFSERMTHLSEQIGELRAMILDRDRSIQEIELKAVKAADLVESVQPDKLMIELQKMDAKFEALKANLEGNESIMERIMEELKEMRKKMDVFRGIQEIIKLSEEVKKEIVEIKEVEASISVNADKVDTIYAEIRRKYKDIDIFNDSLQELKVNFEQNLKDIESIKTKLLGLAEKDEVEKLSLRMQKYIESLKEINKKSALTKDLANLKSMLDELK